MHFWNGVLSKGLSIGIPIIIPTKEGGINQGSTVGVFFKVYLDDTFL